MLKSLILAAATLLAMTAAPAVAAPSPKPTIVLVHGAFADSSSWRPVIERLNAKGYPVVAAANTLRSVPSDVAAVSGLLKTIKGPVVLVGHSYGGVLISGAAQGAANVKALVYVAAFAPDTGESAASLSAKFPGSALGTAIAPAPLPDGADLYIRADRFHAVFAADVGEAHAVLMQQTQRAVTQAALTGAAGEGAWKTLPSWFVYGDADLCIPAQVHAFMADRAKAKQIVAIPGASHVVMISHPDEVAAMIERAAASVQ